MYNEETVSISEAKSVQSVLFCQVFVWMAFALAITGLTAMVVVETPSLLMGIIGNMPVFFGLLIGLG